MAEISASLVKALRDKTNAGMMDCKKALTETVKAEDVPRLVVYVSRELTGRTMVTMRNLRVRRLAWVLAKQRGAAYESVLEALLGEKPSLQLLVGTDDARTAELLAAIPP